MPIVSIFDVSPETVICFGKFLNVRNQIHSVDYYISNGPRVPASEFMKYNKLIITNDHDFVDRFHLTYYIEPNEKKIPNREFILDINSFMFHFGFMNLYIWLMWFYVFLFGN
jgi:hypothetical protein